MGGVAPDATLFALGYLSDVERDYLLQNAAGDMCSRFYDEAGQVCLPELDARTVSLSLADLHDKERRVCIAGGRTKVRALAVALSAGYVSHLVTDLAAAQGVLDYAERNNLPRPPGRSTTG